MDAVEDGADAVKMRIGVCQSSGKEFLVSKQVQTWFRVVFEVV